MRRALPIAATLAIALIAGMAAAQIPGENSVAGQVCAAHNFEHEPEAQYCQTRGIPNATVKLAPANGVLGDVQTSSTTTGIDGTFQFDNVASGEYQLTIERQGFEEYAQTISVPRSEKLAINLAGLTVEQTILIVSENEPVSDAWVRICCDPSTYDSSGKATDANGEITLTITSGFKSVEVQATGFHRAWADALLDGNLYEIPMKAAPKPDALVRGVVVDQDGNPVADARINAYSYSNRETPVAYAEEKQEGDVRYDPYYGQSNAFAITGPDGTFEIPIGSGEVSINAEKEGHARAYRSLQLASGEEKEVKLELPKFPEKTAKLTGRVVDANTGEAIKFFSINVQSPRFGQYECSQHQDDVKPTPEPMAAEGEARSSIVAPDYYRGCAITINDDGTFSGMVTPGYSIINVYHDNWRACQAKGEDGYNCGPEYYNFVVTKTLKADGETKMDIKLRPKAKPDATVSGYILTEDDTAIPKAQVHFWHMDGQGWGQATTDKDGSYKIRLRNGPHQISVYAEGFLQWQGQVDVVAGSETPFDIVLTEGSTSYGGCCYYAHGDTAVAESRSMDGGAPAPQPASAPSTGKTEQAIAPGIQQEEGAIGYEDLGGGLGPYDKSSRSNAQPAPIDDDSRDSPSAALALLVAGLVGIVLVARRKSN